MVEHGLEHLDAWRMAKNFTIFVYRKALPCLPEEEKWGLSNQLRRSSQSIPANIAEGYGRYYFLENVRFCYIARGSLEETFSHLILAHELGYLPIEIFDDLQKRYKELLRLLNGYIVYLKKSRKGESEFKPLVVKEEPDPSIFPDLVEDSPDI